MAYSDAARVDEATKGMTDVASEQTNFRAAVKVFGDAVETVTAAHKAGAGLNDKDEQAFRDMVIDLCRYMDAAIR